MRIIYNIKSMFGKEKNTTLILEKFMRIIELSKEIQAKARWWYCETHEPLEYRDVKNWCKTYGIALPEEYIACLTITNGFTVDYCSTTGYFHIEPFHPERPLERSFSGSQLSSYKSRVPFKDAFGWLNHHCFYYDAFSGELFLEHERYHFTPIKDFAAEILDPVIKHLETELKNQPVYQKRLAESLNNPMRPLYDDLMKYVGDGALPARNIELAPPAAEEDIIKWENENGFMLPDEYRSWLMLSNGSFFGNKFILSLDQLQKAYKIDPIDGVEYVIICGLTGCFDYLMFNTETGEYAILTEDFEVEEAAGFEDDVFLDAFEYFDDE